MRMMKVPQPMQLLQVMDIKEEKQRQEEEGEEEGEEEEDWPAPDHINVKYILCAQFLMGRLDSTKNGISS